MQKLIGLFGDPDDAREVHDALEERGYRHFGYEPQPSTEDLFRADVVVLDRPSAGVRASSVWRGLQALCRSKPVLLFSDREVERAELRRWGAYYCASAARDRLDLMVLLARAKELVWGAAPDVSRQIMVGESAAIAPLRRALQKLASSPSTGVLLQGEPGCGKRTFARALHAATAAAGGFVDLSEAEDIEAALPRSHAGTIYLGDLRRLSSASQKRSASLLAALEGPRLRVVAALTTSPGKPAETYLNSQLSRRLIVTLDLPPLRERLEDLPHLVEHLLARLARSHGAGGAKISPDAQRLLEKHVYPDNVRELEGLLRRALLVAGGASIEAHHVPVSPQPTSTGYRLPSHGVSLELLEREVLTQALHIAGGNRTRAASLLGLTRDQVRYRLAKLQVPHKPEGAKVA